MITEQSESKGIMLIEPHSCRYLSAPGSGMEYIEKERIRFIVRRKFRKATGSHYLGPIWLVLDPLIFSLIYLFVFTVLRARIEPSSIFIGVTLYHVLSSSLLQGFDAVPDLNGGLNCERVSTKVLVKSSLIHRFLDILLATIPTSLILVFGFKISISGGFSYIIISQFLGFMFFGLGLVVSPVVTKISDLKALIKYVLRLGFYASPTMIPMHKMSGIHFQVNEYNPFSYFVELSRHYSGLQSKFTELNFGLCISIFIIMSTLTIVGIIRIDNLRWRMTTWS